jgi:hypothetical protein
MSVQEYLLTLGIETKLLIGGLVGTVAGLNGKKGNWLAEIKSSISPSLKPYSADIGSLSLSVLEATDYEKGNPFAEMYGAVDYSVITNGEYFAIIRNINTPDKGLLPVLIEDTYFPHRTNKTIDEFKTCFGEHELASVGLRIDENGTEYLDLYGGHAVISIGHSHPTYVKYITHNR